MSARIIIEKDGERWEVEDAEFHGGLFNEHFSIEFKKSICRKTGEAIGGWIKVKPLPPVVRTDNSEVIARLEAENETARIAIQSAQARFDEELEALRAENSKLREALKPVLEVKMSAERINSYRIHELHVETFSAVRKAQEIILAHGCASTQEERNDHQA